MPDILEMYFGDRQLVNGKCHTSFDYITMTGLSISNSYVPEFIAHISFL